MRRNLYAVRTAVLAAAVLCAPSLALADAFTVHEPGGGTVSNVTFIDYSYQSLVNQTATDGTGSFTEQGAGFFGSYRSGLGSAPLPSGLGTNYNLYATFTGSGTVSPITTPASGIAINYSTFDMTMWLDPGHNTTAGTGATVGGTTSDDVMVGQSTGLIAGQAHAFAGLANGDFDVLLNFRPVGGFLSGVSALNLANADFNGVFSFANNVNPFGSFTNGQITGSGNFSVTAVAPPGAVPEPSTALLLGSGLVGLGWLRRRLG